MSKELYVIEGKYFFVDDDGEIYDVTISVTSSAMDRKKVVKAIIESKNKLEERKEKG